MTLLSRIYDNSQIPATFIALCSLLPAQALAQQKNPPKLVLQITVESAAW